jgi:hypothetical protein
VHLRHGPVETHGRDDSKTSTPENLYDQRQIIADLDRPTIPGAMTWKFSARALVSGGDFTSKFGLAYLDDRMEIGEIWNSSLNSTSLAKTDTTQ